MFNSRGVMIALSLGLAALGAAGDRAPLVDFGYAFATPHRMTVARPDSSDKTLLDLEPGSLRLGWTYENLLDIPVASFVTPPAVWGVRITPQLGGKPFEKSAWTRAGGYLPILENTYTDAHAAVRLDVAGGANAALVRVTMTNPGAEPVTVRLNCDSQRGFFGYNPAYVDAGRPNDCLLAGWGDRADRVIILALGADELPAERPTTLSPVWNVPPGGERVGWIVRPYRGYTDDLPRLRTRDWQSEFDTAQQEWKTLIDRTVRVDIPDPGVRNGFYTCVGELFIMREPVQGGYIASTPGTDGYRAANPGEAAIVAVALDQLGLSEESAQGLQVCLDQQGADGDWADPKGWGHLVWCAAGFKSWALMQHYLLTGNRDYLEAVYPRMLASSRWMEMQRARTRIEENGEKPLTYGLLPRGMGDCGLKDGDDLYGVFIPHNIWALSADRASLEAAEILGKTADVELLRGIYERGRFDLLQALERGAIQADGYRWIPGVPGKTCGSRWGALNALFPCGLLPPNHELIEGTLRHLRANMSPGGLPLNTGWMPNGLWVAIALDNLAEAHLVRGEGDPAADLLYATLNHATPLYTWCEERGPEPGAKETTGDRQHLWTPVSVVRALRDMLVMEDGATLHLARGTHRAWLAGGEPVGIHAAPTPFGRVSFTMTYDAAAGIVRGQVSFPAQTPSNQKKLERAVLDIRLPGGVQVRAVNPESGAAVSPEGSGVYWETPTAEKSFEAILE